MSTYLSKGRLVLKENVTGIFCFEYFLPGYLITTYMPAPPVELLLRSVLA